ncbi:hypothetical protein HHI36_006298 [Cryptolaemus montrouzieri]|uniref:Uncharacterized protein n=1 Tax=Cryptolaemus montrouzieri TaxID=559131 RepID=A0ABD2NWS6_9CUCU
MKALDEIEERFLALLSKIAILAAPIPKAVVVEGVVSVSAESVLLLQVPSLDASISVDKNERIDTWCI